MGDIAWLGLQALGTMAIFIVIALWSVRAMRRRRGARNQSALSRSPDEPMLKPAPDVTDPSSTGHAPHHLSAVERLDGLAEPTDARR